MIANIKACKLVLIFLFMVITQTVLAQNVRFLTSGVIEYEKRVNMYALIKDEIKRNPNNSWLANDFDEYQRSNPQFKSLKSTLTFSKNQTFFKPVEEPPQRNNNYWGEYQSTQQNNTTLINTLEGTILSQKEVYEETYMLKDSVRKINWKITDEIRNIAGYDCRRANALIMDSIYVVAFYSDEIPVSGGPESFTGLPGMILGVALPYEHITWFATAVTDQSVTEDKMKMPTKGKPIDTKQLTIILRAATKSWGDYAQDALKAFLL